jgi:REP element-mobilizing transposase RayT
VVTPEHVHPLLGEPQHRTLADALKSLKQGMSRQLIGKAEHFWQKRYYDSIFGIIGSSWRNFGIFIAIR